MITNLAAELAAAAHVFADSSSDGNIGDIGYVFLLSGFVFYGAIYLRYRNTNKRHEHESETEATMHNVRTVDNFNRRLTGLSNSKMKGANNRDVRGARTKLF